MKGFILAAGLGTRLKPWTLHHPKALVPVGGIPMLQRVIQNMKHAGITDIVINLHHFGDQIVDFIKSNDCFGVNIAFSDETDQLLDTGGAILKAAPLLLDAPVLIHNADIFTDINLSDLISHHTNSNVDATLLTSPRHSSRQLLFGTDDNLKAWINHKTGERLPVDLDNNDMLRPLSFNGIHIINPTVIEWLKDNKTIEPFSIIPQYISMCDNLVLKAYTPVYEYQWIDIGKQETLKQAQSIAY